MEKPSRQRAKEAKAPFRRTARRDFLATTAAMGALPWFANAIETPAVGQTPVGPQEESLPGAQKSILGSYGPWAASLPEDPPKLSYRRNDWNDLEAWRTEAKAKAAELIASPRIDSRPNAEVIDRVTFEGLEVEELAWQLPYGRPTKAVLLKPQGVTGRLPAVLGLHDHGGNKYFGHRKITKTNDSMHTLMVDHQQEYYGGRSWANELARQGYVVLVHDAFAFASRRVLFEDMREIPWGGAATRGLSDANPESIESIKAYNDWASAHEHVMAKSLFCGGTTWPGVFLAEDRCALDVLCAREDVDTEQIGCAGLSGGGLRTVYLGGLDPRIKCAVCVGFMSTWKDFLLNKAYTHTWMTYTPLLPNYLDFPEILGLRVPLPTMTQSCTEDTLYTVREMEAADRNLQDVFSKAGAPERYQGRFYPGGHKFDVPMQKDAFAWFDQWLKD